MDDLVFKILCQCLYDDFHYDEGFSMSRNDASELEKILSYQFFTNPVHYSEILERWNMKEFIERWYGFLNNTVSKEF